MIGSPGATVALAEKSQAGTNMTNLHRIALAIATFASGATSFAAAGDESQSVQSYCAAKTSKTYGFQCQGQAQLNPALGLEPVTLVGTVSGSPSGVFDGYATLNSGTFGTLRQHLIGPAQFQDRTCFGHIRYKVFVALPAGNGPELPPLDIDFTVVAGGHEILGAPTGYGSTGADVPRLACRLVNVKD
jgi:hypothetical protein